VRPEDLRSSPPVLGYTGAHTFANVILTAADSVRMML
jgi:hypothetical protein